MTEHNTDAEILAGIDRAGAAGTMSLFTPPDACPARHVGPCDAVLSPETVISTLESHGFAALLHPVTRVVEAFEPATIIPLDGGPVRDASAWVPVPRGVHALAEWLGY
jgi:hypothetical protein